MSQRNLLENATPSSNKNAHHFVLSAMMAVYEGLDINQKVDYMNTLSTWYMREKDILRAELDKEQNKNKREK